jgi:hypothetical protein
MEKPVKELYFPSSKALGASAQPNFVVPAFMQFGLEFDINTCRPLKPLVMTNYIDFGHKCGGRRTLNYCQNFKKQLKKIKTYSWYVFFYDYPMVPLSSQYNLAGEPWSSIKK